MSSHTPPERPASTARPADLIVQRSHHLRNAPSRARAALALSLARLVALDGPARLGWSSQRDYARARLGVPWGRYQAYRRTGVFLAAAPSYVQALVHGRLTWTTVESAAALLSPPDAETVLPVIVGRSTAEARALLEELHRVRTLEANGHSTECDESEPARHTEADTPAANDAPTAPNELDMDSDPTLAPGTNADANSDPTYETLHLALPTPVAAYIDDTLALATALLGRETPEDQAFAAVIAEASTEIEPTVPLSLARRHWSAHHRPARRRKPNLECERRFTAPTAATDRTPSPECERRSAPHTDPTRTTVILDRWIRRALDNLRHHRTQLEDTLLELFETREHQSHGFPRFTDFTREHFDLPARTTHDHLATARRRRTGDPIALALAQGRITRVQLQLLQRLHRAGVPKSARPRWIDFAATHTVRALRAAVHWARTRQLHDARAYTLDGCPPPTDAQLRTPVRTLEEIAADPTPPGATHPNPSDSDSDTANHTAIALDAFTRAPITHRTWTLEREAADLFYQLAASLETKAQRQNHRAPRWWPILQLFYFARKAWSQHHARPINHPHRKVLERDQWTCSAPDCSNRRNLQTHHIHFRSNGGTDEPENLTTLCAFHHLRGIHKSPQSLRIQGRATAGRHSLRFTLGPKAHAPHNQHYEGDKKLLTEPELEPELAPS